MSSHLWQYKHLSLNAYTLIHLIRMPENLQPSKPHRPPPLDNPTSPSSMSPLNPPLLPNIEKGPHTKVTNPWRCFESPNDLKPLLNWTRPFLWITTSPQHTFNDVSHTCVLFFLSSSQPNNSLISKHQDKNKWVNRNPQWLMEPGISKDHTEIKIDFL